MTDSWSIVKTHPVPEESEEEVSELRRWWLTDLQGGSHHVCVKSDGLDCARPEATHIEVVGRSAYDAMKKERDEAVGLLRQIEQLRIISMGAVADREIKAEHWVENNLKAVHAQGRFFEDVTALLARLARVKP